MSKEMRKSSLEDLKVDEMAQQKELDLQDQLSMADNRKVVVEDLLFIDDLEIILYTTVQPKTSTIFISNLKKETDE